MSEAPAKSPTLGKMQGKTLINVTDLMHKMAELEKQVGRIPELEARITALEGERAHGQQQLAITSSQAGIQDVANLWRTGPSSTAQPAPAPMSTGMGSIDPALNRYSSEMNLVQAIKDVQKATGQQYPSRSIVAQHMILMGTNDKTFTFKVICKRAEKCGLVELGTSGFGGEWITLKNP